MGRAVLGPGDTAQVETSIRLSFGAKYSVPLAPCPYSGHNDHFASLFDIASGHFFELEQSRISQLFPGDITFVINYLAMAAELRVLHFLFVEPGGLFGFRNKNVKSQILDAGMVKGGRHC